jgi:hypothetical protein
MVTLSNASVEYILGACGAVSRALTSRLTSLLTSTLIAPLIAPAEDGSELTLGYSVAWS